MSRKANPRVDNYFDLTKKNKNGIDGLKYYMYFYDDIEGGFHINAVNGNGESSNIYLDGRIKDTGLPQQEETQAKKWIAENQDMILAFITEIKERQGSRKPSTLSERRLVDVDPLINEDGRYLLWCQFDDHHETITDVTEWIETDDYLSAVRIPNIFMNAQVGPGGIAVVFDENEYYGIDATALN